MNLLIIDSDAGVDIESLRTSLEKHGASVRTASPAVMSAFTSMVIANELKKQRTDAIIALRIKDAQAAISARKISDASDAKIAMIVASNTEAPRGIPADVRSGVDAWIFPSRRMAGLYPPELRNARVVPLPEARTAAPQASSAPRSVFVWAAPIDGNTDSLRRAIRIVDNLPTLPDGAEPSLKICGRGKAQHTMPAVREHRAMEHSERVAWLADDYDLDELAASAAGIVQGGSDPTALELAISSEVAPLVTIADGAFAISSEFPAGARSDDSIPQLISAIR